MSKRLQADGCRGICAPQSGRWSNARPLSQKMHRSSAPPAQLCTYVIKEGDACVGEACRLVLLYIQVKRRVGCVDDQGCSGAIALSCQRSSLTESL
jgi:hypothetical protein